MTFLFGEKAPFEEFVVGFWPEYDHPGVLVTIQIDTPEALLPYDIAITLPDGAKMALKREMNDAGEEELVKQEIIEKDGKSIMPIHLTEPNFYSQFYFNPFAKEGRREMSYDFETDKDLDHYHIIIQEHMAAENFQTSLQEPETFQNDYGITFYRQHLDDLKAGEKFNIRFSYDNPEGVTTVDVLQKMMANHPEMNGAGQAGAKGDDINTFSRFENARKYTFVLFFVLVIIVIIIVRWKGKSPAPAPSAKSDSHFCTSCGQENAPDVKFCTNCGKSLHVS